MKKLVVSILLLSAIPSLALAGDDVISDLQTKMKFLNNRQSVISQNIANANTPKYKASDLAPLDFSKSGGESASTIQLTTTAPGHLGGNGSSNIKFKKMHDKNAYDVTPNGNNVVLEEQMIKMTDTDMDYSATTNMLKQMNGLIRTAVGGR
jgi:flagellar basal-body rod protein FlgB